MSERPIGAGHASTNLHLPIDRPITEITLRATMSFEWQDRDAAARTLGVDTHTLQAWIDDGRAPSRTYQNRLQVLIEHLDEPDETAGAANKQNGKRSNASGAAGGKSAGGSAGSAGNSSVKGAGKANRGSYQGAATPSSPSAGSSSAAGGKAGIDSRPNASGRAGAATMQGQPAGSVVDGDGEDHVQMSGGQASSGEAPSRDDDAAQSSSGAGGTGGAGANTNSTASSSRAERVHAQATTTDLELVSKRELQLAGGMVAAWQRLAETSNQDLARARKVGTLSWSLVAVLLVAGGIGLWSSTRSVTDALGKLDATEKNLTDAQQAAKTLAEDAARKAGLLESEVARRMQELSEANARLAATVERADLTKSQAQAFADQHLLTKQLADKQIETGKALAAALQSTIDQQKARLDELNEQIKAAAAATATLQTRLTEANATAAMQKKALDEAMTERDLLRKQVDQLTADHTTATALIGDLKKQVGAMQTELEKLKKETTSTAEKPGN